MESISKDNLEEILITDILAPNKFVAKIVKNSVPKNELEKIEEEIASLIKKKTIVDEDTLAKYEGFPYVVVKSPDFGNCPRRGAIICEAFNSFLSDCKGYKVFMYDYGKFGIFDKSELIGIKERLMPHIPAQYQLISIPGLVPCRVVNFNMEGYENEIFESSEWSDESLEFIKEWTESKDGIFLISYRDVKSFYKVGTILGYTCNKDDDYDYQTSYYESEDDGVSNFEILSNIMIKKQFAIASVKEFEEDLWTFSYEGVPKQKTDEENYDENENNTKDNPEKSKAESAEKDKLETKKTENIGSQYKSEKPSTSSMKNMLENKTTDFEFKESQTKDDMIAQLNKLSFDENDLDDDSEDEFDVYIPMIENYLKKQKN